MIGGKYSRFQAKVGMAIDSASTKPLNFFVVADDRRVKTVSGVGINNPQKVDIPIAGVSRLAIGIEPSEGSSAAFPVCPGRERVGVWIDPRVTA